MNAIQNYSEYRSMQVITQEISVFVDNLNPLLINRRLFS